MVKVGDRQKALEQPVATGAQAGVPEMEQT